MTATRFVTNGARRAEAGCVVTYENAAGRTLAIHRVGPPTRGLRESCAIAVAIYPTFRIVSYSTPGTIYADLRGRGVSEDQGSPPIVEMMVATAAGVRAMVHPRIIARSEAKLDESKQRRARERWAAP